MTDATSIAMAYHEAWTGHDVDRAMTYIADDIVSDTPAGRLEGVEAFRGFMGPFDRQPFTKARQRSAASSRSGESG